MGQQSASRLSGDDYQHLYSWYELLQLLQEDSPYEYAVLEHPEAGATDDVTLLSKAGASVPKRFVQVKWHVDYRDQYTFDSLTTVTSGARSLLEKLFDSWKLLRGNGPVEVWLVSNWSPAPDPDLGSYLGRGRRLKEEFFASDAHSVVLRARQHWAEVLGATEAELREFCRDLRMDLGYYDVDRFFEQFNDRMARYGLRMGENARAIVLDEVRQRVQRGGDAKKLTRQDVIDVVNRRGLQANHPAAPRVSLWIHAWARQAYDRQPTVELDWLRYFDREQRRIASRSDWDRVLSPELRSTRDRFALLPDGKYIDVRGKVPLTAALAVGAAFSEVAGFTLRAEQPTAGETHLWRSDSPASDQSFTVVSEQGSPGQDVVLGLGVSGPGLADLERLRDQLTASALVYAEPKTGTGPSTVRGAADCVALVRSAKELFRLTRSKFRPERFHLVLFCPATFALFLGQVLNAVGTIVTYERALDGSYQPSVILYTG